MAEFDEKKHFIDTISEKIPPYRMRSPWKPIETAPKDETDILAVCHEYDGSRYIRPVFWEQGEWKYEQTCKPAWPTHWMPLPDPPSAD